MTKILSVLSLGLLGLAAHCAEPGTTPAVVMDTKDPSTWETAVNNRTLEGDQVADALIAVAQDDKRTADDRRKAILLLGQIGTMKCISFLISNISLELPLQAIKGDSDKVLQRPCVYSLAGLHLTTRNWNVVPAVLEALAREAEIPQQESRDFTFILKHICGKQVAEALVTARLARVENKVSRANLEAVRECLK